MNATNATNATNSTNSTNSTSSTNATSSTNSTNSNPSCTIYNSSFFISYDGLAIFEQQWRPTYEPKTVIALVHGYKEHSSRYGHFAQFMVNNGYAVETYDLRGHGKSEGERAFIWHFDEYISDLQRFLSRVYERNRGKTVFLMGHSTGGTIATLGTMMFRPYVKGLILTGPALVPGDDISPLLVLMAPFIGILTPRLETVKLDPKAISRDPVTVKQYQTDPLNSHTGAPARFCAELLRATKQIQSQMELIDLPLIILHGTADRIIDIKGSKELYQRATSEDKTLKCYEGLYHEILNEPERKRVMTDILEWLEKHIETSALTC